MALGGEGKRELLPACQGIALWMLKQPQGCCEVIWSFPLPLGGIVPALDSLYRPPAEEIAQLPQSPMPVSYAPHGQ